MRGAAERHWDFFRLLEKDLITISESIELAEDNYNTYGPRLVQLILSTGSELEAALRDFAVAFRPKHRAAMRKRVLMTDYKALLVDNAKEEFSSARVRFLNTGIELRPWSALENGRYCSLDWWNGYNSVKHERNECYERANLRTALGLIAALFVVNIYLDEVLDAANWRGWTLVSLTEYKPLNPAEDDVD